jgi:hypothetical protein
MQTFGTRSAFACAAAHMSAGVFGGLRPLFHDPSLI